MTMRDRADRYAGASPRGAEETVRLQLLFSIVRRLLSKLTFLVYFTRFLLVKRDGTIILPRPVILSLEKREPVRGGNPSVIPAQAGIQSRLG